MGVPEGEFDRLLAELREREASLRRSEARLEEVQRIAHVGYWERDLEAGRITLSGEAGRIFGLEHEEHVSLDEWHRRWLTLIHPEDRPKIADAATAALSGGPAYDVEYRVVRPGGDVRIVHSRADVARDGAGRPTRMFGVMQDVTELREAEREVEATEARFRALVDHAADAFFLHDDDLLVVDVNRQACQSLGYRREELIGMHPAAFDVGLDAATLADVAARVAAGEAVTFESRHRRKDGTVFPVEIRSVRFQHEGGRLRLAVARDIGDRKRAERELRRSQTFLAEAQGLSHTGSFGWNPSTGELVWSRETHRIFGLDPGTPPTVAFVLERTHPEDRAAVQETVERAAREGTSFDLEHRLLMPDGSVKHLHVVARLVPDEDQRAFAGAIQDVTARKRAEEERRGHVFFLESMDRVNRAIQGTNDLEQMMRDVLHAILALFDCDRVVLGTYAGAPDATSVAVTAKAERPGFESDLVAGTPHPLEDDLRAIPRALSAARGPVSLSARSDPPLPGRVVERYGVRSALAMPVRTKLVEPGRLWFCSMSQCSRERAWTPQEVRLFEEIGRRLGDALTTLSSLRDLRESEARFRMLAECGADAFMLHGENGTVLDVNRQACEALGYTREELIGMSPARFEANFDPEAVREIAERVYAGEVMTFETRHRRKDGTVFPVEVRGRRIFQGDRVFGISLSRDITDRKRAEDERERLRQAQADLARISRMTTMGELTASIAHEVKQPIAAAATNAEACIRWLARDRPDLQEARDAAARIVADATRAAQVIDRVRSLYGKSAPRCEPLDVNEVVRETLALLGSEASRYSVSLRSDLGADLPAVSADRVQLQQVLVNLVLNGIEAMKEAPGALTVVSRRGPDGGLLMTVSDEGVGLPDGAAGDVFDAFFSTKPEGTGLGLTISRSIVEAHGGRLWAVPRDGRGASFHVALPAAGPAPATARPRKGAVEVEAGDPPRRSRDSSDG